MANTIACVIVGAKLDYCNSLLYSTSVANIAKLQRVQNSLARVVTGTRKYDHITPTLAKLHWLPVSHRITFKVATLTFKTLQFGKPTYLSSRIHRYHPSRDLRSANEIRLQPPNISLIRIATASIAFSATAPTIWNNLPTDIRAHLATNSLFTFRREIKKYLFQLAFPPRR